MPVPATCLGLLGSLRAGACGLGVLETSLVALARVKQNLVAPYHLLRAHSERATNRNISYGTSWYEYACTCRLVRHVHILQMPDGDVPLRQYYRHEF